MNLKKIAYFTLSISLSYSMNIFSQINSGFYKSINLKQTNLGINNQLYKNIQEADCPDSLIGSWSLNEKSGSVFADVNGNDAVDSTPPIPTDGILNGAQTFSASTYVDIPDNGDYEFLQSDCFSIVAWVRFNNDNNDSRTIVGREITDGTAGWWLGVSNLEKPTFVLMDQSGEDTILIGDKAIDDNIWHQIVGVWDGNNNKALLYVDGIMKREGVKEFYYDFNRFSKLMPVNIGYFNAGTKHHFVGDIDEVAIFKKALNSTEITEFYNSRKPRGVCEYQPAFTSVPVTSSMDSVEYMYELITTDLNNDELTFAIPVSPDWLSIKEVGGKTYLTGIPDTSGVEDVTITVTDSITSPVLQNFQITVVPYNKTPEITNQDSLKTKVNTALTLSLGNFTIFDPDSGPGSFIISVLEGTNYIVDGTKITPASGYIGFLNVGVQVTDGITNSEIYYAKVKVYESFAPVFTSVPDTIAMDSVEYKYVITATDQNGDTLDFDMPIGPDWLSLIERNDSVMLIGIPDTSGIFDVTIVVTDYITTAVSQNFKIKVNPYGLTPIITGQSTLSTLMNTPITLTVANFTIIDPDTDPSSM